MAWYPIVGWLIFFITFVAGIVLFIIYRKLYNIFYLIAISLYIFTISFMIDVFEFQELGILITLVTSAVLFMGLGYYLSMIFHKQNLKK